MSGLPKSPVSWPITGGIATKNAPIMLAAGSHLVLQNVRQERANEWRTRAGFDHAAADDLPGANVPVLLAEAPWGGLVGLCRQTTFGTAGRVYSPNAGTRWITPPLDSTEACSQLTPGVWTRRPVGPMTTGAAQAEQLATAEGGSYRLTAWWASSATGIQVVLQTIDGVVVQSWSQYGSDASACRPRCVYSASAGMLVLVYQDGSNNIVAHRWSATTGAFVGVTLISAAAYAGAPQAAYVDALNYGGASITIAFRNNTGTGQLSMAEFTPATGIVTVVATGLDCSKNLALFPDPDASGIRMVGICNNVPDTRVVRLNSAGVVQTNDFVEAGFDAALMTGCAYNAGADWMCVYVATTYSNVKAVKKRLGVVSAPATITTTGRMYSALVGGAWREAGTDAMRYMLLVTGAAADDIQPTFLEMAIEFENNSSAINNAWTEPQARLLSLNAGGAMARGGVPQTFRLGTDKFLVPLARITEQLDTGDNLDGSQFAIDTWTVQYLNSTTRNNQNISQGTKTQTCAFFPAGTLLHTGTGQLLCSHGASAIPFKPALTPSVGAGSLDNTKTYVYGVSCIMPDENGNAWRSPISVTASMTPALWAGGDTVSVAVTMTQLENQQRRRIALIWRTDGNGSTLKLLHVLDGTVASTASFTFVDTTGDVNDGETFTAEVQTGLTPAFLHVELWNDRMWGVDRDFPTKIWFTKPLSQGLLPEFIADPDTGVEFSIDIDDEFGPITGLASTDYKLFVFKERATYVVSGDGPDNVGNGAFPSVQRISEDYGVIVGGKIESTGSDVYITTLGGLYSVNAGQQFKFVGAAIDRYLGMPLIETQETITGIVYNAQKGEMRVQTDSYRFVHDTVFDLWIQDTGGMLAASGIVMTRLLDGLTQAVFTSSGQMWTEAADSATPADAGTAFSGVIRSAWIRPADVGGWLRLYRARLEGLVTATGTPGAAALAVYFDDKETIVETFSSATNLGATAGAFQAEVRPKRGKCKSFSLQLTLPSGDATVRLEQWWVLVAPKAGAPSGLSAERWT